MSTAAAFGYALVNGRSPSHEGFPVAALFRGARIDIISGPGLQGAANDVTWAFDNGPTHWEGTGYYAITGGYDLDAGAWLATEDLVAPFGDLGDDDHGDPYPHEYVAAASAAGITQGVRPGEFLLEGLDGFGPAWDPYNHATRGEVAQMPWTLTMR